MRLLRRHRTLCQILTSPPENKPFFGKRAPRRAASRLPFEGPQAPVCLGPREWPPRAAERDEVTHI
jgi:hypothetical protein